MNDVPQAREGVEDSHAETAEEFLERLSPRHALWQPWRNDDWVFRGQAGGHWELQPKANRDRAVFDELSFVGDPWTDKSKAPDWNERRKLVNVMLKRFIERVNRSGIIIPVDFPKEEDRVGRAMTDALPWPKQWAQLALAQHHGLPTPLLDWSRRPYVAAYFAAYFAAEARYFASKGEPFYVAALAKMGTHLAVWVADRLRRNFLDGFPREEAESAFAGMGGRILEFYEPPAATNPNLHAQQGLFSLFYSDGDPPLESLYARLSRVTKVSNMKRLTLPLEEAPKLLRLLADEGVDGAALFPTTDGVVRAMKEVRFYDRRS